MSDSRSSLEREWERDTTIPVATQFADWAKTYVSQKFGRDEFDQMYVESAMTNNRISTHLGLALAIITPISQWKGGNVGGRADATLPPSFGSDMLALAQEA